MKTLKTTFKWLAIVGGSLLSMVLLAFAFVNWRAGVCLEDEMRPLKQAHEPMSLADLAPAPVSPEGNAATYLRRAEKSVTAMMQELAPLMSEKHDEYYENQRLNQHGIELVETAFAAYPEVMPLLEQAADAPDYVPDHDYTQPPQLFLNPYLQKVQQSRAFARILQYRAELLLAQQNREESMRTGLLLLRLSRHFEREPVLVGYLVAIAVQSMAVNQIANALNEGPVPSELHDRLDVDLSWRMTSQAFVAVLKSERAYGIDSFRDFRKHGLFFVFKRDECDYLKRMAAEIAIGAAPRYQVETELTKMTADSQAAGTLTRLVTPALEAAREAQQRLHARLQCLSVLNALTRREQTTDTAVPSIEELGLPDEITTDPYIGQPLKIARSSSGWIVYSVGPNQKDDGGKIEKSEDVGVGPKG